MADVSRPQSQERDASPNGRRSRSDLAVRGLKAAGSLAMRAVRSRVTQYAGVGMMVFGAAASFTGAGAVGGVPLLIVGGAMAAASYGLRKRAEHHAAKQKPDHPRGRGSSQQPHRNTSAATPPGDQRDGALGRAADDPTAALGAAIAQALLKAAQSPAQEQAPGPLARDRHEQNQNPWMQQSRAGQPGWPLPGKAIGVASTTDERVQLPPSPPVAHIHHLHPRSVTRPLPSPPSGSEPRRSTSPPPRDQGRKAGPGR